MSALLAIGAGLVAAGINAYAAYKKGEISKEEYERAIASSSELERQLKSMRPDDKWENIDPKLLSEAAKFSPDIAAFVQENAPQLIQEAGSATEKRVQRQALQKYAAQAETGRDVISDAQREQALFEADARAKQRQQALVERMRQQGMLGTGGALAAQLQTEQATAQEARQVSLQGVQEAEMRRRQALGEAAQLAGQMRQANVNVESANVATMNAFNQRLANAKNLYNQYASGERNRAQEINQQRQRETERYNLGLTNQYALMNRREALAAKERARQFDYDLANRMYDIRNRAEAGRSAAKAQQFADYATAVTSGMGVGMSAYGAFNEAEAAKAAAGASNSKEAYFNSLLKSAGQGAAYGAGQSLGSSSAQQYRQPQYNLGIDTRIPPYSYVSPDMEIRMKPRKNVILEDNIENPEIDIYSPYRR